jgi:serine/threonine-protein kinase RsbW
VTPAQPSLRLALSNRPGCIEIIRAALDGLADVLAVDALARNDLATAVEEACKNVVLHAYEGVEGPLELELLTAPDSVTAVVRDRGIGIRPHLGERTQPHTGIGMPIVHLLSRRVTYTNLPGGGTEVRMELDVPGVAALPALPVLPDAQTAAPVTYTAVALAVIPDLAAAVTPRLIDALTTREQTDPQLLAGLQSRLAQIVAGSAGDAELRLLFLPTPGGLSLEVGPVGLNLAASMASVRPRPEPGAVVRLELSD